MTLIQKIDEIWQSNSRETVSRDAADRLSIDETAVLTNMVYQFDSIVKSRKSEENLNFRAESSTLTEESFDRAGFLYLVMLAIHHSDSLVYLPHELREARLTSWAEITSQPLERVRIACSQGPAKLMPLLKSA